MEAHLALSPHYADAAISSRESFLAGIGVASDSCEWDLSGETETDNFSWTAHSGINAAGAVAGVLTYKFWLCGVWSFYGRRFVRVPSWGIGSRLNAIVVSVAACLVVVGGLLALPIEGTKVGDKQLETAIGWLSAGTFGFVWAAWPRAVTFLMIPAPGAVAPRAFAPETANYWFGTNREATFDEIEAVAAMVGSGAVISAMLGAYSDVIFAAPGLPLGRDVWPLVVVIAGLVWAGVAFAVCHLAEVFSTSADIFFASVASFFVSMPLFVLYSEGSVELRRLVGAGGSSSSSRSSANGGGGGGYDDDGRSCIIDDSLQLNNTQQQRVAVLPELSWEFLLRTAVCCGVVRGRARACVCEPCRACVRASPAHVAA
jgi:hypothetical protein